ncbi:ankyrin repeat domain-containing protein [Maribacter chungangensis]|uniref:Ankyrin repeat domain-containing protein n=1 Tax=Maribacter chungangensis TaxID=1069117 RepID=A0ABW3B1M9_9FLAO
MKILKFALNLILFLSLSTGIAQDNIFLKRDFWKANPTIAEVESAIEAGNDVSELNSNMFDAVCYALLAKTDNATVKHLLTKKGNAVDKLTHDGRTYLFWAAYRNNLEIMEYLVANGARADIKDSHGYTIINFAARGGQTNTALYDFLLKHNADIKDTTNSGANALLLVAPSVTDFKTFDYFKNKGLDLNSTDHNGNGLFHYTAKGGDIRLLKKLKSKGLAYNQLNKLNGNAILMASEGVDKHKDALATFTYLESLGLEPNITDKEGRNPLHAIAYKSDDLSIFRFFIEKGVAINQKDKGGDTPFMNAANSNELSVVQFLMPYVNNINLKDENGRSALAMAVNKNTPDVVDYLLQNGADIATIDEKGNSLAYYLLNTFNEKSPEKFESKLKLLQAHDLDLTAAQYNGNSLLHLAARDNNMALLKRLEEFKFDINKKNEEGNTALHLAAMTSRNDAVLKYLISKGADRMVKTDFNETVFDLANENELLKEQKIALEFLK